MIVLFTPGGRTGNQLFQFAYAWSNKKKREWLMTLNFGKTRALLFGECKKRWMNLESNLLRSIIEHYVYPILYHLLVKPGVVSSHYELDSKYVIRRGKISCLTIMRGYFESWNRQDPDLPRLLRFKASLRKRVRPFLASLSKGRTPVFVHLRRADFYGMSVAGQKIVLPDRYYARAVKNLTDRFQRLFFVIVGDDPEHAEELFTDISFKFISRMSAAEDLALMSLCEGGILSNSTFAWWGAFFGGRRIGYIVPRFWSGWASGSWYPPEIWANFMTEVFDV